MFARSTSAVSPAISPTISPAVSLALRVPLVWFSLTLAAGAACTDPQPSYTQFPVPLDTTGGGLLVEVNAGAGLPLTASVDTFSPFTIVDRSTEAATAGEVSREVVTLALLATDSNGQKITRARFTDVEALATHPCPSDPSEPTLNDCLIGLEGNTRAIRGIVGADLLARNAVRFDFVNSQMSFFPDIAGDSAERGQMCEAVIDQPFQGGGTAIIGGAEVSVTGRRIAIDGCFFQNTCDGISGSDGCDDACGVPRPVGTAQGVSSLFVVSTGLPVTIINRTTYEQYLYMHELNGTSPAPTAYEDLPETELHVPSGPVVVRMARMNNLALVAESSDERGPCEERYANDYLTRRGACPVPGSEDCPCPDDDDFCRAGAVAELTVPTASDSHTGFAVAVVPDSDPTLQALRNELRPESPEVSGILGVDALSALAMDVDYPNGRVLLRCSQSDGCVIRPQLLTKSNLEVTRSCMTDSFLGCLEPASPGAPSPGDPSLGPPSLGPPAILAQ